MGSNAMQREISAAARGISSMDFIQRCVQEPLLSHAMWGRVSRLVPSHAPSRAVPRWHNAPILLTRLLVHVGRAVIIICRCCCCSDSRPLAVSTCSVPVARDLCPALCKIRARLISWLASRAAQAPDAMLESAALHFPAIPKSIGM